MSAPIRAVIAFLMALGILISIADLFSVGSDYGFLAPFDVDFSTLSNADQVHVNSVVSGSRAEREGVRAGDVLHLEDLSVVERVTTATSSSGTWRATDLRTGKIVILTKQPHKPLSQARRLWDYTWLSLRVVVEIAGLAILLLRGGTVAGAGLAIFLFFDQFAYYAAPCAFFGPVWMTVYWLIIGPFVQIASYAAIVVVAFAYLPQSARRKGAEIAVLSAAGLFALAWLSGNVYAAFTGVTPPFQLDVTWYNRANLALLVTAFVVFIAAIRSTYGVERRRLVILSASIAVGGFNAVLGAFLPVSSGGIYTFEEGIVAEILTIVMVIGLVYGFLVERLFDIEFVLNRAVVFTIVSAIVVVCFAAIEWLIGAYAGTLLGKAQSIALQMLIALGIGLWLRRLHSGVDAFVDRWLFEERHRRANALMTFATEAATISSPDSLLQATVRTLRTFGGVSHCEVLLANEKGDYERAADYEGTVATIHRDDLVAVRLRTSRRPLDRHDFPPLTYADVAFPMTVGHELSGILLCSHPHRAEPYSPEEIEALATLSHEVAMALVALEAREARRMRQAFALDRVT